MNLIFADIGFYRGEYRVHCIEYLFIADNQQFNPFEEKVVDTRVESAFTSCRNVQGTMHISKLALFHNLGSQMYHCVYTDVSYIGPDTCS